MHGYHTLGVALSVLLHQRRAVSSAAAPAYGLGGQELDIALRIADRSKKLKAGPAFAAHTDVVSHWAPAVWNKWLPIHDLQTPDKPRRRQVTCRRRCPTMANSVWPGGGLSLHPATTQLDYQQCY